jgi:molybdopterin molybdotransferase
VFRRARVGIVATGDELVEPACIPGPSQIRNTNACQLEAQARAVGATAGYYGIAADREHELAARIRAASADNDVILLSGGVSAGDYDLVPPVLRAEGFELLFEKVAIKPGMPTVFGTSGTCFCFGLPGNPVSTFVLFEVLVKPFLFKLMGHDYRPREVAMRLCKALRRRKADRAAWVPVAMETSGTVRAVEYHGSAHLNALTDADGLVCVPVGVSEMKEGTTVVVRQL